MALKLELSELAEIQATDRVFLSVYLAGPQSVKSLSKRFANVRRLLERGGHMQQDEQLHFDENISAVDRYLKQHPLTSGSLALFSCWVLGYFKPVPLKAKVKDHVWIDSSPFIRPLAEIQDEYENVAVVVADNKKARVYLVSSAVAGEEEIIKGNVKNHVRKGGWSQKRYERRRDKQLLLYARDICDTLAVLSREESFRRILLVGGREILLMVRKNLPKALQKKVADKALDLSKGEDQINEDIMELFFEQERLSEEELWQKIRCEYLRGGLAVTGLKEVLAASKMGRVDTVIVNRHYSPEGWRCRVCNHLEILPAEACSACGCGDLFRVGVVNEIVEMLKQSGAEVDFCEPFPSLLEAGEIAALLRY